MKKQHPKLEPYKKTRGENKELARGTSPDIQMEVRNCTCVRKKIKNTIGIRKKNKKILGEQSKQHRV